MKPYRRREIIFTLVLFSLFFVVIFVDALLVAVAVIGGDVMAKRYKRDDMRL